LYSATLAACGGCFLAEAARVADFARSESFYELFYCEPRVSNQSPQKAATQALIAVNGHADVEAMTGFLEDAVTSVTGMLLEPTALEGGNSFLTANSR
jgi:hypothetical protein